MGEDRHDGERERRHPRWRRRLVRLGKALLLLLGMLAVALWLLRDLPRRLLEQALSARLDARVRIAELRLRPDLRLGGVSVERMRALPALERASASGVEVHGRWRSLLRGEIDRLVIHDATARLEPVCGRRLELPEPRARLEHVELAELRLEVAAGSSRTMLHVRGGLEDRGSGLGGTLTVVADELDPLPLVALWRPELSTSCGADPAPPLLARLRAGPVAGSLTLERAIDPPSSEAGAASLLVVGRLEADRATSDLDGHGVVLRDLVLDTRLELAETTTLAAELGAGGMESARLDLELPPGAPEPRWRFTVAGLELESWLPLLDEQGRTGLALRGSGILDAEAVYGSPASDPDAEPGLSFHARARLAHLETATLGPASERPSGRTLDAALAGARLDDVVIETRGEPAMTGGDGEEPVRTLHTALDVRVGRIAAPGLAADLDPPGGFDPGNLAWLSPLRLVGEGDVEPAGLEGSATLETASLGAWRIQGRAVAAAEGTAVDAIWSWSGDRLEALAALWQQRGGHQPAPLEASGTVRASGSVHGPVGAPSISARLELADAVAQGSFSERRFELHPAGLSFDVDWTPAGGPRVRTVDPVSARVVVGLGERPPLEADVTVTGASWTREKAGFARLDVDTGGRFGSLLARGAELALTPGARRAIGSLELTGLEAAMLLEEWHETASSITARDSGSRHVAGTIGASLGGTWDVDAGSWTVDGTVRLEGGEWSAGDGSRAIVGLEPALAVSARGRGDQAPTGGVEAHVSGPVGDFQMLWDTYFFDLTGRQAQLDATALLSAPAGADRERAGAEAVGTSPRTEDSGGFGTQLGRRLLRTEARLIGAGFEASWEAARPPEGESQSLRLRVPDLDTAWKTWIREPITGSGALAERLDLAGEAAIDLHASRTGELWRVTGAVGLTDAAAELGDEAELHGLQLELPLDVTVRSTETGLEAVPPDASSSLLGSLRFERLRAGEIEVSPVDAALAVRGDGLSLRDRLEVPLFGGTVDLDTLSIRNLLGAEPSLEADVSVAGLDLRTATEAIGQFPLEGSVEARFPRVRLQGGRLETEVDGAVSVFGGRVEVTQLAGSDLFSSFPRFEVSASLLDIDLAELTRTLEFGEITGIASGEIRDLVLVGGSPVRFRGRLQTVPTPRVKRKVSIRAVDNIARLGTGSDLGVVGRGVRRLFDSYPYRSLGIALALERDDFVLRGLERRDGRELFLKGRWPLRLDIVNVKPGSRVSFSTMMRRLGNLEIQRAGAAPPD